MKIIYSNTLRQWASKVNSTCFALQGLGYTLESMSWDDIYNALDGNNLVPDNVNPERFTTMVASVVRNPSLFQEVDID